MKKLREIYHRDYDYSTYTESTMDTFHSLVMDTLETACKVKIKLGGRYLPKCHVMESQKYVCMDELMKDIQNEECIVYSFGVGNDFSFEKTIAEMGCTVFANDPTVDYPSYISENFSFEKIGVVGTPDEDELYQTLDKIFENNGHTYSKISYLKLDIEGAELSGLPIWLKSGALKNVQQIAIEIHLLSPEEETTLDFLKTFIDLNLIGNFRIINWEANNCWKNLNKKKDYFGLSAILLKKINPVNICTR